MFETLISRNSGYKHKATKLYQHKRSSSLSTMIDFDLMNTSGKPLTMPLTQSILDTVNAIVLAIKSDLFDDNILY